MQAGSGRPKTALNHMCLNRQNSAERIRAPSGDRGRRPAVGNIEVEARRRRVCVDIAGSAADAEAALELINYDVAILDLGLPDGDSLAVLAAARRLGKMLPILILTARDAVEDRVSGFNAGSSIASGVARG